MFPRFEEFFPAAAAVTGDSEMEQKKHLTTRAVCDKVVTLSRDRMGS